MRERKRCLRHVTASPQFCCCGFCVQNGVTSPIPNWLLNPELSFSLDRWSIKDREPSLLWYLTHSWGGKAIDVRVAVVISTVSGISMLRSLHSYNYRWVSLRPWMTQVGGIITNDRGEIVSRKKSRILILFHFNIRNRRYFQWDQFVLVVVVLFFFLTFTATLLPGSASLFWE